MGSYHGDICYSKFADICKEHKLIKIKTRVEGVATTCQKFDLKVPSLHSLLPPTNPYEEEK